MTVAPTIQILPATPISQSTRFGAWVVPLLVLIAFSQSYFDLQAVMAGELLRIDRVEGPLALRSLKDVSYGLILFSTMFHGVRIGRFPIGYTFVIFLLSIALLFFLSMETHGALIAAIGVRWAIPLLLFLLMKDWPQHYNGRSAMPWLFGAMFICIALQLYQAVNMPPVFGTIFGFTARTPGFFTVPLTAGFFGCTAAAFIMIASNLNVRTSLIASSASLIISTLAQTGTGLVVSLLLIAQSILNRFQVVFAIVGFLAVAVLLPNLNELTGRENYTQISGGDRIVIFQNIVAQNASQVDNFGFFTNAALLSEEFENRTVVDSLYGSWIGNFGALSIPLALALLVFLLRYFRRSDRRALIPAMVFVLYGFTTIIFEAYPMNMLLIICLWMSRREQEVVR